MTAQLRWWAFRRVPWIWAGWERIYMWSHPVTPVRPGSLFAFRRKGDALELHLAGRALSGMQRRSDYSAFQVVHQLREELSVLASRVRSGELGAVSIITGTSLVGEAGGVLGFETRPLPRNLANVLKQYFFVGLDAIYHPRGLRSSSMRRWPVEIRMTTADLLRRYPEKSARSTDAR